ncbi:MAG TPA: tetratricopeptide repeat protein [Verrucomicrobiae bacterium]|nr:tetratricopeptide repeat protein [Verrucomicrobiae bacterium]
MTLERHGPVTRTFVTSVLPWLAGIAGLLVYLITGNRWVSVLSLGVVTQTSGWTWRPETGQPLTFVVLYPFRWLPGPVIPLALNLFTSVCAAGVLALLARSVALLRHDLAPDDPAQQQKPVSILSTPTAWMPPVLAVMLCGLQLSFWEHATAATGEMIDLLVFAFVIRCLLEYRLDSDESWLWRGTIAYAAGMANNWAMLGYLPIFLGALVITRGLRAAIERSFLRRLGFWALAGLSLYLLLPLVHIFTTQGHAPVWTGLKLHFKTQLEGLALLRSTSVKILALTSLLPVLILSIRWKSHTAQMGDDTKLGVFITKMTAHLMHGLFLAISLWLALDPSFSPRHLRLGAPMLTYYYLSALVFGYCVGYFLLFDVSRLSKMLAGAPALAGCILVVVLPAALVWRNLGQVQITNGPALHVFARQLYDDVPKGKSVVLSEDGMQLLLLQAELNAHPAENDPILLNTIFLPVPQYQKLMANRYKSRWPMPLPLKDAEVQGQDAVKMLVKRFAEHEPLVYLHPSAGLLVEPFRDEPNGLVHRLVPVPAMDVETNEAADAAVEANERLWDRRWTNGLSHLAQAVERSTNNTVPDWACLALLRLTEERNLTAFVLGLAYSKSLDDWGVRLQRLGRWAQAGVWFERAIQLNPANLSSRINLLYNQQYRKGHPQRLDYESVTERFQTLSERYENWPAVLSAGGPVDEPSFLFKTAQVLLPGSNFRQAAGALVRCSELAPVWPAPRLWLARTYLQQGRFAKALVTTDQIEPLRQRLSGAGLAGLLYCRGAAMRALGRTNDANVLIASFLGDYAQHEEVLMAAITLFEQSGQLTRELEILDQLLRRDPNNGEWLAKKGCVQLQLSSFPEAVATLTKALAMAPADQDARLYRAVAYLGCKQLEPARQDYEELLKAHEFKHLALFGLGEIAWREQDTNQVIEMYQQYLSNALPGTLQYAMATQRLNAIKTVHDR